jgi:exo-1,4-beta-D-glucosaminidase
MSLKRRLPRAVAAALLTIATVVTVGSLGTPTASAATVSSAELTTGWALRTATGLADTGATISQVGYSTAGWNPISVPSTVLAGLVANNVYTDIYSGTNMQSVPDLTGQDWWYRGQFTAAASSPGQVYWLRFKGIRSTPTRSAPSSGTSTTSRASSIPAPPTPSRSR